MEQQLSAGLDRYRGQWGGKIENGEEMWWSEPNWRLRSSGFARLLFRLDVRHHFLLRFWNRFVRTVGTGRQLKVLDYGCGAGGTTLNFSAVTGHPITGVDIFETQLKIARQFAERHESGCSFEVLGAEGRIPAADSSVDAVFSLDVLGHVPDIPAVLREFLRVLRPGGRVILFTESSYSEADRSIMAGLARSGADMMLQVPEHISLFPREALERMFAEAGFRVVERFSANVWHFFFFPKDYVLLLKGREEFRGIYRLASVWNRISKVFPFYPWPFQILRLLLTRLHGRSHFGTSYFYDLEKAMPNGNVSRS